MASCGDDGCRGCVRELAVLAMDAAHPLNPGRRRIMPQPEWCQEAAMIGFLIDRVSSPDYDDG